MTSRTAYWRVLYPEYADPKSTALVPEVEDQRNVHGTLRRKAAGPPRVDRQWSPSWPP